ncbi:MAG: CHRD domain-containing protein [Verrucomicrobiota bacterium]
MATIPLIGAQREQLFVGNWYFAVTSPEFPNGEIRAQIPAVPEPTTHALFGLPAITFCVYRCGRRRE